MAETAHATASKLPTHQKRSGVSSQLTNAPNSMVDNAYFDIVALSTTDLS